MKKRTSEKRISLAPLKFEDARAAALETPPEPKKPKNKTKAK
jgi:hypothetical protein